MGVYFISLVSTLSLYLQVLIKLIWVLHG